MSRDGGEGGGLVNEQAIMKLSDILALQSMKATYCETVDDCARMGMRRHGELAVASLNAS